jgi:uncharacterized protein
LGSLAQFLPRARSPARVVAARSLALGEQSSVALRRLLGPESQALSGQAVGSSSRGGPPIERVPPWLYREHVIDEAVIREAGRRLAAAASSPARVVLFGSHARGAAGPHSDLDFLVVEPHVDDELEEAVRLRRSLRGLGVPADVIVVSRERAEAAT